MHRTNYKKHEKHITNSSRLSKIHLHEKMYAIRKICHFYLYQYVIWLHTVMKFMFDVSTHRLGDQFIISLFSPQMFGYFVILSNAK